MRWRKSAASGVGNCVEVTYQDGLVWVRDSKNPDAATLAFTPTEWEAFLEGAAGGEFTLTALGAGASATAGTRIRTPHPERAETTLRASPATRAPIRGKP